MAGIYIHIPWCRRVCIYCDFHFSVSMRNKHELLECMLMEMEIQKNFLQNETVESVYFGGGTPSVLDPEEIANILSHLRALFDISVCPEVTLEANPDDMSVAYLKGLRSAGINRLSIGVQSFSDDDLIWMNRRHNSDVALQSIENSRKAGFENISIDLIYGLPGMNAAGWEHNLETAIKASVQHISAYHLTLEKKTVYAHRVNKGILQVPDETEGLKQYERLMDRTAEAGFTHYEISNFCMPGYIARHNTSYWQQKKYLGIGPSANSYNGYSRQWNIRNNSKYIQELRMGKIPCNHEELTGIDRFNEYVLTSLRTHWGADIVKIERDFGRACSVHFLAEAQKLIDAGKLDRSGDSYVLSRQGKFFADGIISDLFIVS